MLLGLATVTNVSDCCTSFHRKRQGDQEGDHFCYAKEARSALRITKVLAARSAHAPRICPVFSFFQLGLNIEQLLNG